MNAISRPRPIVEIEPADLMALCYVARNMRAADADEIYAGAVDNPDDLALHALRSRLSYVAFHGGVPVSAFGAAMLWPGVWNVWMFATDDWPKVSLSVTRFIRRILGPALQRSGAHHAQCWSAASHTTAHRWLESLGAQRVGVAPAMGRNREDFILFAWSR